MKYEQRILWALGITSGILLLWSLLTPPPALPPPAAVHPKKAEWVAPPEPQEAEESFSLGPHQLKIGMTTGGVRSWSTEDRTLLESAAPGFLELRAATADQALALKTIQKTGEILSHGSLNDSIEITRELQIQSQPGKHLLQCRISIENHSSKEQEADFQAALYKPLFEAQTASKRHFSSGTVWIDGKPRNLGTKPGQLISFPGAPDWVVAQNRSNALVVQPKAIPGMFHVEHSAAGGETGWLKAGPILLKPGEKRSFLIRLYAGPAILSELRKAGMEDALFFGVFSDITHGLLRFLSWSYSRLHNYGWAICLLSLAVWLPFSPLTWYGMRISQEAMKKMAVLKPQETRIRREHKNNPQKMQQELMELYRKHKVNPASGCIGCLPLLLTWPVYFALFQVLNRAPELQGASFFWIRDLSASDALIRFPVPLPFLGAGLNILPLISTALYFVQQKAMTRPPTGELTDEQKIQQQMMKMMPLVLLFVFYNMPSGFMLYWVINSGLMAGQQVLLARAAGTASP